ncbi:hypothetical protein RPQ07_07735 [Streptomyces sp. AM8-1-1]|nr:hypothetical protein [Streptomyces sp. AM8-1-1]WNO71527.1 hypothetical protein RPQ07_07735 [Streptomyces sp. AM8-1-1]
MERDYSGPARVGGGPGTGKTIVALHRVRHLVSQLPAGRNRAGPAHHVQQEPRGGPAGPLELGGEELLGRVEISRVDPLALRVVRVVRVVREAEPGNSKQTIDDNPAPREWRSMLGELNESGWDAEFLTKSGRK